MSQIRQLKREAEVSMIDTSSGKRETDYNLEDEE
jgi:hypothetical protein